jgi:hypothetical protein
MRQIRLLGLMAATLMSVAVQARADDATHGKPAVTGQDNAVQRIEAASARQMEILTALLSKVPEQARPGIEKAIAAAQAGHDQAIAALTGHGGPGGEGLGEIAPANQAGAPENTGKPEATGLERARAAVAGGFEHATTTLQGLLDQVPSRAASRIEAALNRLGDTRTVALRNLDALIAGERPDHPDSQVHAERPVTPERPDRPERPERPQLPERPERPQPPDHPTPPNT